MQRANLFSLMLAAVLLACNPTSEKKGDEKDTNTQSVEVKSTDGSEAAITGYSKTLPLDKIKLPQGFKIDVFAEVNNARSLAISPAGIVYVGNRHNDKVYAVQDTDGDFKADKKWTIASGLSMPNGVAFRDGDLYVAEDTRILKFSGIESKLNDPGKGEVINDGYPKQDEVMDDTAAVNFRFKFNQQPGRFIINLKHVSKSYGPLEILKNTSVAIEKTDKIALIGANGKGKSTLLRIIAGEEPIEGERVLGYNVIKAFYAQHQLESLHLDNEILEELKQAGSGKTEQELRNVLGCFLFSDEDQLKKVKVLSGGEKSRVALAKTLISEANFLLLDEPTNHLDFISENILIQALQQYQGAFVVVSHNRHFVSQIANKIWYIEDKQIKEYPGTYEEYEYWKKKNEASGLPKVEPPKAKVEKKPEPQPKTPSQQNQIKVLEKELKKIEELIGQLENNKTKLESEVATPEVYTSGEKLKKYKSDLEKLNNELAAANSKWEELVNAIDEMGNQ